MCLDPHTERDNGPMIPWHMMVRSTTELKLWSILSPHFTDKKPEIQKASPQPEHGIKRQQDFRIQNPSTFWEWILLNGKPFSGWARYANLSRVAEKIWTALSKKAFPLEFWGPDSLEGREVGWENQTTMSFPSPTVHRQTCRRWLDTHC